MDIKNWWHLFRAKRARRAYLDALETRIPEEIHKRLEFVHSRLIDAKMSGNREAIAVASAEESTLRWVLRA